MVTKTSPPLTYADLMQACASGWPTKEASGGWPSLEGAGGKRLRAGSG